eukprot:g13888.t1
MSGLLPPRNEAALPPDACIRFEPWQKWARDLQMQAEQEGRAPLQDYKPVPLITHPRHKNDEGVRIEDFGKKVIKADCADEGSAISFEVYAKLTWAKMQVFAHEQEHRIKMGVSDTDTDTEAEAQPQPINMKPPKWERRNFVEVGTSFYNTLAQCCWPQKSSDLTSSLYYLPPGGPSRSHGMAGLAMAAVRGLDAGRNWKLRVEREDEAWIRGWVLAYWERFCNWRSRYDQEKVLELVRDEDMDNEDFLGWLYSGFGKLEPSGKKREAGQRNLNEAEDHLGADPLMRTASTATPSGSQTPILEESRDESHDESHGDEDTTPEGGAGVVVTVEEPGPGGASSSGTDCGKTTFGTADRGDAAVASSAGAGAATRQNAAEKTETEDDAATSIEIDLHSLPFPEAVEEWQRRLELKKGLQTTQAASTRRHHNSANYSYLYGVEPALMQRLKNSKDPAEVWVGERALSCNSLGEPTEYMLQTLYQYKMLDKYERRLVKHALLSDILLNSGFSGRRPRILNIDLLKLDIEMQDTKATEGSSPLSRSGRTLGLIVKVMYDMMRNVFDQFGLVSFPTVIVFEGSRKNWAEVEHILTHLEDYYGYEVVQGVPKKERVARRHKDKVSDHVFDVGVRLREDVREVNYEPIATRGNDYSDTNLRGVIIYISIIYIFSTGGKGRQFSWCLWLKQADVFTVV